MDGIRIYVKASWPGQNVNEEGSCHLSYRMSQLSFVIFLHMSAKIITLPRNYECYNSVQQVFQGFNHLGFGMEAAGCFLHLSHLWADQILFSIDQTVPKILSDKVPMLARASAQDIT